MHEMIKALLQYTRLLEKDEQAREIIDADAALKAAIDNLQSAIVETGAQIEVPPSLPNVMASEIHLTQIFQNLISNSLKYRRSDELPRIRIGAERQNAYWCFSVADNGIGFNPQYGD